MKEGKSPNMLAIKERSFIMPWLPDGWVELGFLVRLAKAMSAFARAGVNPTSRSST